MSAGYLITGGLGGQFLITGGLGGVAGSTPIPSPSTDFGEYEVFLHVDDYSITMNVRVP